MTPDVDVRFFDILTKSRVDLWFVRRFSDHPSTIVRLPKNLYLCRRYRMYKPHGAVPRICLNSSLYMKLYGISGKGTGKLGNSVFAIAKGEQIVRQYNPQVTNPSTEAQVNQRARLKLASSLTAAMRPVIAIPSEGLKSSGNLFIKKNFGLISALSGTAEIALENVQLTNGTIAIPDIVVAGGQGQAVTVELESAAPVGIKRVVYAMFARMVDGSLSLIDSTIVETAGEGRIFAGELAATTSSIIVFAYGMQDNSESATAKYANLQVNDAVRIASLVATRTISADDYTFTRTVSGTNGITGSIVSLSFGATGAMQSIARNGEINVSGPASPGTYSVKATMAQAKAGVTYTLEAVDGDGNTYTGATANFVGNEATLSADSFWAEDGNIVLKANGEMIDNYCTFVGE